MILGPVIIFLGDLNVSTVTDGIDHSAVNATVTSVLVYSVYSILLHSIFNSHTLPTVFSLRNLNIFRQILVLLQKLRYTAHKYI